MSGKEMCLCDWYTKCPNCLKPRTGYARLADDCAYLDEENKRLEAERDALYYTLLQISRTAVPEEQSTATRELRVVTLEAQKALERVLR